MVDNLYLSGFMGSGKSTIGPLLAQRMGWKYVDLDRLIEARAGMRISRIFKEKGELNFRDLESEVLQEVSQEGRQIVALGGGTLLREENRRTIEETGFRIYLKADVHTLAERIIESGMRPLLDVFPEEPIAVRVRVLMRERKPEYEKADLTINTDGKSPHQTVQDILTNMTTPAAKNTTAAVF